MELIMDKIFRLTDRGRCFDLFYDMKIDNEKMYQDQPVAKLVQYRLSRQSAYESFTKLTLMKNLRAFSGFGRCTFIELVEKTIELAKVMFILDLGLG